MVALCCTMGVGAMAQLFNRPSSDKTCPLLETPLEFDLQQVRDPFISAAKSISMTVFDSSWVIGTCKNTFMTERCLSKT